MPGRTSQVDANSGPRAHCVSPKLLAVSTAATLLVPVSSAPTSQSETLLTLFCVKTQVRWERPALLSTEPAST